MSNAERARQLPDGPTRVVNAGLRMQSVQVREVLARMIDPALDYATVVSRATGGAGGTGQDGGAALTRDLARLVGLQHFLDNDTRDAVALYDRARLTEPVAAWPARDTRAYAQLLWLADPHRLNLDHELLEALPADFRELVDMDLEGIRSSSGSAPWLGLFNNFLTARGVDPVGLGATGGTPFDRLCRAGGQDHDAGPMISIIMPVLRPGAEIDTAVRSIVEQTWQNWELLVVDDGSGADYDTIFDRVAHTDPRIRVVRTPQNLGTYAARNLALDLLQGEFVTIQDADDWSHPQRLERQVAPLLEDESVLRTLSWCIRASDQLVFQYLGFHPIRSNASSHMFRRSVLNEVGRFDWARKSADTEFDRRLEAAFPGRRVHLSQPLAMYRLASSSLSRSDFRPGWMHPERAEYRSAMRHWHRRIEAGASSPWMPADVAERPLTAPRPYLRGLGAEEEPVEIAFAADWTKNSMTQRAAVAEIRQLAEDGRRVGLIDLRSLDLDSDGRPETAPAARQLIADGTATFISLEEPTHAATVVVREPDVLEFPSIRPARMTADKVVFVVDALQSVESARTWSVADCDRNARALFGVEPLWASSTSEVRQLVLSEVPGDRVVEHDYPDIVRGSARLATSGAGGDRAVIGWMNVGPGSLPDDAETMTAVYPQDDSVDIRLMGGRHMVEHTLGRVPAQWVVYEPGELRTREFLRQLDFLVGFPSQGPDPEAVYLVHEALAQGLVAVLDPRFEPIFGDAAIYSRPSAVSALIDGLHRDSGQYRTQASQGRDWAQAQRAGSRAQLRQVLALRP